MVYDKELLKRILAKTRHKCHLCHRALTMAGYGRHWHVDHSVPRAAGGTDHLNNLYPACTSCNCRKRDGHNGTARARNGKRRSPLSPREHTKAASDNTFAGGAIGAVGGALLFGPFGFLLGMFLGACLGTSAEVRDR